MGGGVAPLGCVWCLHIRLQGPDIAHFVAGVEDRTWCLGSASCLQDRYSATGLTWAPSLLDVNFSEIFIKMLFGRAAVLPSINTDLKKPSLECSV